MCQSERAGAQSWRCRATTITIVIYDTRFLDNYRENFYNGGYHGSGHIRSRDGKDDTQMIVRMVSFMTICLITDVLENCRRQRAAVRHMRYTASKPNTLDSLRDSMILVASTTDYLPSS